MGVQCVLINDGRDLHLHHGPIDLIVSVTGSSTAISRTYDHARIRFDSILTELVSELPILRLPTQNSCSLTGCVAKRMWDATSAFIPHHFITPMASVAGAVADEVLSAMKTDLHGVQRMSVNNGGDISYWLASGESTVVGIAHPLSGEIIAKACLTSSDNINGVATSGRRGRSLSLGIADSVTVLACDAASADAAATLIANAVDLPGNSKVVRTPAQELAPDTDLGDRQVTVCVNALNEAERRAALQSGLELANRMKSSGRICAAYLFLQGQCLATEQFDLIHGATGTDNTLFNTNQEGVTDARS